LHKFFFILAIWFFSNLVFLRAQKRWDVLLLFIYIRFLLYIIVKNIISYSQNSFLSHQFFFVKFSFLECIETLMTLTQLQCIKVMMKPATVMMIMWCPGNGNRNGNENGHGCATIMNLLRCVACVECLTDSWRMARTQDAGHAGSRAGKISLTDGANAMETSACPLAFRKCIYVCIK